MDKWTQVPGGYIRERQGPEVLCGFGHKRTKLIKKKSYEYHSGVHRSGEPVRMWCTVWECPQCGVQYESHDAISKRWKVK